MRHRARSAARRALTSRRRRRELRVAVRLSRRRWRARPPASRDRRTSSARGTARRRRECARDRADQAMRPRRQREGVLPRRLLFVARVEEPRLRVSHLRAPAVRAGSAHRLTSIGGRHRVARTALAAARFVRSSVPRPFGASSTCARARLELALEQRTSPRDPNDRAAAIGAFDVGDGARGLGWQSVGSRCVVDSMGAHGSFASLRFRRRTLSRTMLQKWLHRRNSRDFDGRRRTISPARATVGSKTRESGAPTMLQNLRSKSRTHDVQLEWSTAFTEQVGAFTATA